MFKNMTEREKKLGLAIVCLVPLFLLFYSVTTFTSKYSANRKRALSLQDQIGDQEDLQLSALAAEQRRIYYANYCLPNDTNTSTIQYNRYLERLTRECGLDIRIINPKNAGKNEVSYLGPSGRTKVFDQVSFSLRGEGKLDQITKFLYGFYSLNMAQRISQLTITPITVGGGSGKEFERVGTHRVDMTVDVIAMVDAEPARDFGTEIRELKKELDDYNLAILRRNMFGPANNAPRLTNGVRTSKTESDSSVSYTISASDADKKDYVSFELISCEIAGAKLVQRKPTDFRATFSCPKLAPGSYKFRVRVTDDGLPNKSTEEECSLTIRARPVVADTGPKVKEEPPKVRFAVATAISGIEEFGPTKKVTIHVRPTDESICCEVGESFELDDLKWTIKSIDLREVKIECDGELLTYNLLGANSMLDNPSNRKSLTPPVTKSKNDPGTTSPDSIKVSEKNAANN